MLGHMGTFRELLSKRAGIDACCNNQATGKGWMAFHAGLKILAREALLAW